MLKLIFLLTFTYASIADNECAQGLNKFVKGFGNLAQAAFGTDIYASMVYYSGKDFNDLGNYDGWNQLDGARYVLLDASQSIGLKAVIGWCLPKACSKNEIQGFFQGILHEFSTVQLPDTTDLRAIQYLTGQNGLHFNSLKSDASLPFDVVFAKEEQDKLQSEYPAGTIIMIILCIFLGMILLTATGLDLYETYEKRRLAKLKAKGEDQSQLTYKDVLSTSDYKPITPEAHRTIRSSRAYQGLLCFSVYTNAHKMFALKDYAEPLDIFKGVRVMAMCNIMLGHFMQWGLRILPLRNFNRVYWTFTDPSVALIYAGFYAVDTFFWMTGTLTGYLMLKELAKRNGRLPWALVYFHRFWRLLPTLSFCLFFIWAFYIYIGNGPLWYNYEVFNLKECSNYWWSVLTFLNNFIPPNGSVKSCMPWTWYLSNDIQFFLITPIILVIYYKYPRKFGWAVLGLLNLCTIVSCAIITGVYKYDVVAISETHEDKFDQLYVKPYCRVASYAIGLGCGWILYSYYQYKESKVVFDRYALWIAQQVRKNAIVRYCTFISGIGLISFVIFVQLSAYADLRNGFQNWSTAENVIFMGFDKLLYGLGLTATLLPCLLGKFPYLTDFLGAQIWSPLAKMTFWVYLTHVVVMGTIFNAQESAFFISPLALATYYLSLVVFSYCSGFILSLCIEAPFLNLEKILFARHSSEPKPESKEVAVN